jgi:outer membrane protein assembly factor BamD (BamD/ComL family)/thioredoxin-related protein
MTHAIRWSLRCPLLFLVAALLPSRVAAQDIQWRTDYNKAREESAQKGLPIVIDFSTENCMFCKKLDALTLRDPAVISLMNERCIPLRIDPTKQTALAEALRVQSYPTLVFATPDGRILGFQEGYIEAPRMKELLNRSIASVATPEWMNQDYKDAFTLLQDGEYPRAIAMLKNIVEDGKDRPVQVKARARLQEIDKQALAQLQRARQLADHGQKSEAIKVASELAKAYDGTLAAHEGSQLVAALTSRVNPNDPQRLLRGRDLLAQAKEDYRNQLYASCIDRCEAIAASYGDLPEATEATQLLGEVRGSPEILKTACDQTGDRLAAMYYSLAESYLKKGQTQQAVYYLERIVQVFPNSKQADAAQAKLSVLQGWPTRSESKKP